MTAQFIFALLLLLLAAACTPRSRPVSPPVAPPIQAEKPKPRNLKPGPNDQLIHKCTVTKEYKEGVDCVCRGASTTIDSVTGKQSMECKLVPQEKKRGKLATKH